MRRITVWALTTLSALVLLLSYRTSTMGVGDEAVAASASTSSSTAASASEPSASASASATPQTYTGDAVDTRWGPVQVSVTVEDGKVTDVQAVEYPTGNHRDEEINAAALPELRQEVLEAQSALIDAVSGATVTSDGYISSLQSALDAAHLGS